MPATQASVPHGDDCINNDDSVRSSGSSCSSGGDSSSSSDMQSSSDESDDVPDEGVSLSPAQAFTQVSPSTRVKKARHRRPRPTSMADIWAASLTQLGLRHRHGPGKAGYARARAMESMQKLRRTASMHAHLNAATAVKNRHGGGRGMHRRSQSMVFVPSPRDRARHRARVAAPAKAEEDVATVAGEKPVGVGSQVEVDIPRPRRRRGQQNAAPPSLLWSPAESKVEPSAFPSVGLLEDASPTASTPPPNSKAARRANRVSPLAHVGAGATKQPHAPPCGDDSSPSKLRSPSTSDAVVDGTGPSPPAAAVPQDDTAAIAAGIAAVLLGGCASFALFEMATLAEPSCRNMLTSFQFLSTAVSSYTWRHFTSNRVPLWVHAFLAALHSGGALLANAALHYGVPTPLFLIIRNGNLAANIAAAWLVFGRRPTRVQTTAVAIVTVGIMVTTWFSRPSNGNDKGSQTSQQEQHETGDEMSFALGVALLLLALCVNALLSLAQEHTFRKYVARCVRIFRVCVHSAHSVALPCMFLRPVIVAPRLLCGCRYGRKAANEVLFFSSVFGLPALLPSVPGLGSRVARWLNPTSVLTSFTTRAGKDMVLPFPTPLLCILAANLATSYLCKFGVLALMARTSSTTSTLSITVYRVISLLVSLLVFNAPPWPHRLVWVGILLVFGGSLLYMRGGKQHHRHHHRRHHKRRRSSSQQSTSPFPAQSLLEADKRNGTNSRSKQLSGVVARH